jgi:hypothetical protein
MAGDCTTETCPVPGGFVSYEPLVGGNAFLLAAFAAVFLSAIGLGLRFRISAFSAAMATGCFLEVLGFLGRLLLRGHSAREEYFTLSLVGTVVGSSFFALAVFLILPHIISIHGQRAPKLKPSHVLVLFSSLAGLVVILEVAGALMAVLSPTRDAVRRNGAQMSVALLTPSR